MLILSSNCVSCHAAMSGDHQSSSRWWSSLTDECPITLEPLSTLPYPPFRLGGGGNRGGDHHGSNNASATCMYFDGLALASYCVSRATFTNPLTREELTWDDCVRLDDYLEEYCYHNQQNHHPPSTATTGGAVGAAGCRTAVGGRISVKEAYGLRSMVKVSGSGVGGVGGINTAQEEANRRRAEALRSEAAAALRGLFVYGNNRTDSSRGGMTSPSATFSDALVVGPGARSGEMVPSAGFALHRLREGESIGSGTAHHRQGYDANGDVVLNEVEGLRIIDDDAAVASGSDEAAWREVQEAFPTIDGSTAAANALRRDDIAEHPERSALLQRAKEVAAQTHRKEVQKQRNEERGRQILIEDALKRRAEKIRLRQERAAKEAADLEAKKAKNEDMARARAEIERWREEQFDMLNRMAEEARLRDIQEQKERAQLQEADTSIPKVNSDQSNDEGNDKKAAKIAAEAAAAERAAKKKAAKRKKERERQKTKKAAEKKEEERLAKIEEERKRRTEAKLKCAHCSTGILDAGFEKMGHLFCSPKCARAGTSM